MPPCSPKCATWSCLPSRVLGPSRPGSSTIPASPRRAGTRSGWRASIAASSASRLQLRDQSPGQLSRIRLTREVALMTDQPHSLHPCASPRLPERGRGDLDGAGETLGSLSLTVLRLTPIQRGGDRAGEQPSEDEKATD